MQSPDTRNAVEVISNRTIEFSVCTMVTDELQYREMLTSFKKFGFLTPHCEYLFIDNTQHNEMDAYAAINVFLRAARGRHVIICHQDVELIDVGFNELSARLSELDRLEPSWGLAGNAGGKFLADMQDLAVRISDPHGRDTFRGPFPHRVTALDENFIVVKASANLATSGDLSGFHCYGMDLAIVADVLGFSSWVIDFHLCHKSAGKIRERKALRHGELHYDDIRKALKKKYDNCFSPRWISSTTTEVLIWPNLTRHAGYNLRTLVIETGRYLRKLRPRLKMRRRELT